MKFSQNYEILPKFWNSVKTLKFGQNCKGFGLFWSDWFHFGWFGMVGRGYVITVGRGYVMNVGSGYVIHKSTSV